MFQSNASVAPNSSANGQYYSKKDLVKITRVDDDIFPQKESNISDNIDTYNVEKTISENNTKKTAEDNTTQAIKNQNRNDIPEKYRQTSASGEVFDNDGNYKGKFSIRCNKKPPYITKTGDPKQPFMVNEDMDFYITYTDENNKTVKYKIEIKKGYTWDGASIPKICQGFVGKNDSPEFMMGSLIHDIVCDNHQLIGNNLPLSNALFSSLLVANGTSSSKASLMEYGVSIYQSVFGKWKA